MRLLFASLLAATAVVDVALSELASGTPFDGDDMLPLQKRAGEIITTGANGLGDNRVHSRLDIIDIANNRPYMWSLYIRTMARWKEVAAEEATGYYGIASIHGVPQETWDGVERCDKCDDADGYCTHDSVHFPAWHRAYLALYEQEFIKVAIEVATSFDGPFGSRLQRLSRMVRAPYWDWASPSEAAAGLPAVVANRQLTILGPDGDETVDNPLFSYHFENTTNMFYHPFTTWSETLRYPTSNSADATSQVEDAVEALAGVRENLQDQVYLLLTQCKDYLGFATDDEDNNACANSLESLHNTIHTIAGGASKTGVSGGHLTYLPLSSFDPLFWIHHINVDRLFALWQVVNPEIYGAVQTAPHNTWTIASGSRQDATSPLTPFRKSTNVFWTTNDVRDFEKAFHYTYPEFVVGDGSRKTILNYINALYGPNPTETSAGISSRAERNLAPDVNSSAKSDRPRAAEPQAFGFQPYGDGDGLSSTSDSSLSAGSGSGGTRLGFDLGTFNNALGLPWSKPSGFSATASASLAHPTVSSPWNGTKTIGYAAPTGTGYPSKPKGELDPALIAPNGSLYQYQCNVKTPRYAFDASYLVYVFDGEPSSDDASTWRKDDNCIGQIGVLAGGDMKGHKSMTAASIPITRHLHRKYKAGKISGLSEDVVVPYMKENLNWKIVYDGREVKPEKLPGYKASFVSGLLSPEEDGKIPRWSHLVPHVEVTKNKDGGIKKVADGLLNAPTHTNNAPSDTGDSPVFPHPPAAPLPSAPPAYPDGEEEDDEEVVTVYTTEFVTYCPCSTGEPTAATELPTVAGAVPAY